MPEPKPYDSTEDTKDHITKVHDYLEHVRSKLLSRALLHDESKLEEPEKSAFDSTIPKLKDLTYGSDEYRAALREMKPALDHHYAENSHHPEHYENGVNGMDLLDLVEMLCDWKAATERMKDGGDIVSSLQHNIKRFNISPQLADILSNTIKSMGWIKPDYTC